MSPLTSDPRYHRLVTHVHSLGPRAVGELLAGFAIAWDIPNFCLIEVLEQCHRLDAHKLDSKGGNSWPTMTMIVISGGRA